MHARHNRASQRIEKTKENKREKNAEESTQKLSARKRKTRSIGDGGREREQKCEAETKVNPEIHGQDSLEPTHGRPRCIENGDFSERVLGAGRGGEEGDSLQVSLFYYFYSPPIYLDPGFFFLFVFFGERDFAKM
jgi:hypothetical protein